MQLMSWIIGRLGSRFSLLLEPYRRRVMHGGTGLFLQEPTDLTVGLHPDAEALTHRDAEPVAGSGPMRRPGGPSGGEPVASRDEAFERGRAQDLPRVFPFTMGGELLVNCEMFERFNSVTFRGYCPPLGVRLEFNIHSVFYPQDEPLCLMPALYLEVRVNPASKRRLGVPRRQADSVPLVFGLRRPNTRITVRDDRLDLAYRAAIDPLNLSHTVPVTERVLSLNAPCVSEQRGEDHGELRLDLPVTAEGSGIKWRLIWACYVDEPVLNLHLQPEDHQRTTPAWLRYTRVWPDLDAVLRDAVKQRDAFLAKSRRIEKLIEQTPLDGALTHLMNLSWQQYQANTFWCVYPARAEATGEAQPAGSATGSASGSAPVPGSTPGNGRARADASDHCEWFSVWEGSNRFHSTLDVEYNNAMFYLVFWPHLLAVQFDQWARFSIPHGPSQGAVLSHDLGMNANVSGAKYFMPMEVEENANFLLLLQAYCRWTADLAPARRHLDLVARLTRYLVWTDRDESGFPVEGVTSTAADAGPALMLARKQTYLAVKRVAGLQAAADLFRLVASDDGGMGSPGTRGREAVPAMADEAIEHWQQLASQIEDRTDRDLRLIEQAAWLGDHYAICVDPSAAGLRDPATNQPLQFEEMPDWDAFSIYTGNALLLPSMVARPQLLLPDRIQRDLRSSLRENRHRYGAGNTSAEPENVRVSQNIWRDLVAQYMRFPTYRAPLSQRHWDLQLVANTHQQSRGFVDTYMSDTSEFYSRGITSLGHLLSGPRLTVDRLAPDPERGGKPGRVYLTVNPERHHPARWPLFPLADWRAGKVPVCVVDAERRVSIEGRTDPIIIHRPDAAEVTRPQVPAQRGDDDNDVIG